MAVSALDCTGCGSCANVCPGKKGAQGSCYGESGSKSWQSRQYFDYAE